MDEIQSGFDKLYKSAREAAEHFDSTFEYEPYFLRLLDYIRKHPSHTEYFKQYFVNEVRNGNVVMHIISFCMHILRWEEVRDAIVQKRIEVGIRNAVYFQNMEEAFDDDWMDRAMYPCFSNAEDGVRRNRGTV